MSTDDVEQKNPNLQELSEAQTRRRIDEQLRRVGWEGNTETLRYSKGTRLAKGRSIAIAEWPTDSEVGKHGFVDYALFVDYILDKELGEYEAPDRRKVKDERWNVFTRAQIADKGNSLDLGLIRDDSIIDYEDLHDPIERGEDAIAQLEEAVDLLQSVVNELKSLK